jgi:hypothetical protein
MMEVWSDLPVIWELDLEACLAEGTLFVGGNSASRDWTLEQVLSSSGASALERVLAAHRAPGGQPEVLIPDRIPRAAVVRIHVPDEAVAHLAQTLIRKAGVALRWDVCSAGDCWIGHYVAGPS